MSSEATVLLYNTILAIMLLCNCIQDCLIFQYTLYGIWSLQTTVYFGHFEPPKFIKTKTLVKWIQKYVTTVTLIPGHIKSIPYINFNHLSKCYCFTEDSCEYNSNQVTCVTIRAENPDVILRRTDWVFYFVTLLVLVKDY